MQEVDGDQAIEELRVGVATQVLLIGSANPGEELGKRVDRDRMARLDGGLRDQHRQRGLAGAHAPREPEAVSLVEARANLFQEVTYDLEHDRVHPVVPRDLDAHVAIPPGDHRSDPPCAPAGHPALAALAGPCDVLGTEDPARAVADAQRTDRLPGIARVRQTDGSRRRAHASSVRSMSGGPSPAFCSTGRSAPPALSTKRGYCSRKTTGTSPVGPLRGLAMIRSASLGSASSSYFEAR